MLVIKIASIMLGFVCLLFGYFIYFRRQYHLINGFEADYREGRKDESYAKRIGFIEFVIGIALLAVGIILMLFV